MSKIVIVSYLSSHYSEDAEHDVYDHGKAHFEALLKIQTLHPEWLIVDYMTLFFGITTEADRERILALECAIAANCDLVVMLDDHEEYSAGMVQEQAAAIAAGVPVVRYSEVMR